MNYPIEKYKFYIATKEDGNPYMVIATSTYAGKTVRGVAKCHPNDMKNFDIEFGKKLAAARCNEKIANKRHKKAIVERNKAFAESLEKDREYRKTREYVIDASNSLCLAKKKIEELLKER